MISARTRAALAAAKELGQRLGNPNLAPAREAAETARIKNADALAASVLPAIADIQASGAKSLRAIASALNRRGFETPRGGEWQAESVRNVLARAA
jgi:DNA invertase Pin-like site-specific DNA recombinase